MGRTTRWLKGLFGIKKDKEKENSGDRRRNSTTGMCNNPATIPPNLSTAEAVWLRSYYSETEKEQNKHAIAVAAATAAAADAAVAAAQAAVAVVRLTSNGRGTMFSGGGERWATVKIQTFFRGYLARKALRALKALVKIQALVRGYLVRKQAAATLHCMQALIRAQATARSQRARAVDTGCARPEARAKKSMERFDDTRSEHLASIHSRRLSASIEAIFNTDESPKIVEIDTGRPKSRSGRTNTNTSFSEFSEEPLSQTLSSPLPYGVPDRNYHDPDWGFTGEECRFLTAQSTPRFSNSVGSIPPGTPAKSVCNETFRHDGNYPNYMANTKSFRAKLRSYSAPKQRPETGTKKKVLLTELIESRSSLSGVRMQRSCSQAQEVINFKNVVMGNFNRSSDFGRETEKCNLERQW